METLIKSIRYGDYVYELVKRNDHVAMYEARVEGEILGYGVFCIRIEKGESVTLAGYRYQLATRELFPSLKMYGTLAFAITTIEEAERYFIFLTGRVDLKKRGIGIN